MLMAHERHTSAEQMESYPGDRAGSGCQEHDSNHVAGHLLRMRRCAGNRRSPIRFTAVRSPNPLARPITVSGGMLSVAR